MVWTENMSGNIRTLGFSITIVLLLLAGCAQENVVDSEIRDAEVFLINGGSASEASAIESASKFFTGRDSFGVALKAKVDGVITDASDDGCVSEARSVIGNGNATHMGKIEVVQEHCFNPATGELTEGSFSFTGTNGAVLTGRYNGTLEPGGNSGRFILEGRLWVEDGSVTAAAFPAEGRGTIQGVVYPDGSFDYELDGWLLHHVRE